MVIQWLAWSNIAEYILDCKEQINSIFIIQMVVITDLIGLQVGVLAKVHMNSVHTSLWTPSLIADERSDQLRQAVKRFPWEALITWEKLFHVLREGINMWELDWLKLIKEITMCWHGLPIKLKLGDFKAFLYFFIYHWCIFWHNVFGLRHKIALENCKLFLLFIVQFFAYEVHQCYLVNFWHICETWLKNAHVFLE